MGQCLGALFGFGIQRLHLGFQLGDFFAGGLEGFQLAGGCLAPFQQFLDLHAEFLLDAVDDIQPAFDLIQLAGVKAVGIQPIRQLGGKVAGVIVQLVQPLRQGRQRFVQPGAVLHPVHGTAQKVGGAALLAVLVPRQRGVRGGDALQNALGVGDDIFAFLQGFFLAGLQGGGVNGVDFRRQGFDAALLVCLPGVQCVQLPFDADQLAVLRVVGRKQRLIAGVLIQQPQVQGGVGQALAVVLTVDGKQPCRNIAHHRCRCGHTVDTAAALALGVDLAVQKQVVGSLIAAFFQLCLDRLRDILKGRPNARLLCAAAHQLAGGAVAQNGVDGVDQDGLARAGLTRKHVEAGGKMHLGLFDDGYIFNFQV